MTDQREPARRGRPRDAAVDERVLGVASEIMLAGGYAALNVDEVAERAGVAKTTLYRRWPTKDHLAMAVAMRMLSPVSMPDTGDLARDLTEYAVALIASLDRYRVPGAAGASAGLAAEIVAAAARHPDIGELVRGLHAQRHAMAVARLERAAEREGLSPDLDYALMADQILGPIYYRVVIIGAVTDRSYAERLVSAVLAGALAPAARAGLPPPRPGRPRGSMPDRGQG